jgi:hypothetical protein
LIWWAREPKEWGKSETERMEREVRHAYRASSPVASWELVFMPVREHRCGCRSLFSYHISWRWCPLSLHAIVLTSVDVIAKLAVQESWSSRDKENSKLDRMREGNKGMNTNSQLVMGLVAQ